MSTVCHACHVYHVCHVCHVMSWNVVSCRVVIYVCMFVCMSCLPRRYVCKMSAMHVMYSCMSSMSCLCACMQQCYWVPSHFPAFLTGPWTWDQALVVYTLNPLRAAAFLAPVHQQHPLASVANPAEPYWGWQVRADVAPVQGFL